jgi:ACS family hexuronate transporter-like MFS transporter
MSKSHQSRVDWLIPGFFLLASIFNYIDRAALSIVSPLIRQQFSLNYLEFAWILNAFLLSYALFYPFGGYLADHLGSRKCLIISITWWSIANLLHALAGSWGQLVLLRALLGMGEACFYPAAIKVIREIFPSKDRSHGVSFLVLGMGMGITLTPPLVAFLSFHFHWRVMFFLTGLCGILLALAGRWVIFNPLPGPFPNISSKNNPIDLCQKPSLKGDDSSQRCSLVHDSRFWVLLIARGLGDAVWFFYIFWLPEYLVQVRAFSLLQIGEVGWIPFFMADMGAWFSGWLSSRLVKKGWPLEKSRLAVLAGSAILVPVGIGAALAGNSGWAMAFISIALFGIMSYGTIIMTLPADLFTPKHLGLAIGLFGFSGSLTGAGFQIFTGWMLDHQGFGPVFLLAGLMHPLAAILIFFGIQAKPSKSM